MESRMDRTRMASPAPGCPACGARLAPATCTAGTTLSCPACHAAVSLVLKPGATARDLTLEVVRAQPPPSKLPDELAARFEVVAKLGAGGQGEVLRVRPRGAVRDYALKWTQAAGGGERGPREANYGVMPAHPNVLAPLQAGWHGAFQYMVFDLVEGDSLAALLAREGRMPAARALALAHQAARALAHVHRNSVIHRDVKPANMLVAADGTLRLTDFGVATSVGKPPSELIIGTPPYLAPEQVSLTGQTPAIDVYALGCVLHELLTGAPPFPRDSMVEIMCSRLDEDAPPVTALVPDCPEPVAKLVAHLLARDPKDRPADGAAALVQLAAAQRACGFEEHLDLPSVPRATERSLAFERARSARRLRAPAAMLVASAVALLCAVALRVPLSAGWAGIAAAWALLGLGVAGLSREWLGDPHGWWRAYFESEMVEVANLQALVVGGFGFFAMGMAFLAFVGVAPQYWLAVGFWFVLVFFAGRVLVPVALERRSMPELAIAPPELRVFVPDDGWFVRILPQGQEQPLAHRLELVEGLNRLEFWRRAGHRRTFLVWAAAGLQLELRLVDGKDGPEAAVDRRRALPPGRA